MSWKRACLGVLALVLSATGVAEAQQTRIIKGTVQEAVTSDAVPGVTVIVKGTNIATITEMDGSFTLTGVPADEVVLQISSATHQAREVTVGATESAVRVELDLVTEQIVVTGRAPAIFRQNLANGASVVKGDALVAVPSQTVDGALQGKVAGANIQSNSGAPGGGIQISMRGVSTIQGRNVPLYVIDGVIVSDNAIASGTNVVTAAAAGSNASNQDNPVNRIADLNPNDIENIEVLKGAAAAALYGSKASNGVVIITTKRGRAGKPTVNITQRLGFSQISNTLGSRTFETLEEVIETYRDTIGGVATEEVFRPGVTFDHEREILQTKLARETAATVSGGTRDTKYLFSGSLLDQPGIIQGSGYAKQTLRMAVDQDFGERLKVSVTSNMIHSVTSRSLTNNDNRSVSHYMVFASTPNFIDLRPYEDGSFPVNPFSPTGTNPLQTVALMREATDVWRNISSVNTTLKVWNDEQHAVTATGTLGVDRFQQRDDFFFPRELHFEQLTGGTVIASTSESRSLNWGASLLHTFAPSSAAFRTATTLGFYYDESKVNINRILAQLLAGGDDRAQAGVSLNAPHERLLEKDQAIALQEEVLLLDERLTILAALLADRSSVNGDPDKFFYYPKASAAYRVPLELREVELLRARAAYGETGNKPTNLAKFTTLQTGATIDGSAGIVLGGRAGNPDIKPERQREFEGGVDLAAYHGRAVVELTLYQRNISDLLLNRQLAPSTGFTSQIANVGSLRNRGVELMLQATPVRTDDFSWLSRIVFSANRSMITDLRVPAFNTGGFGASLGAFRIEKGASATQIVGNVPGVAGLVKLGDTEPDFRVSFVEDFSYKGFTLHTLLDWQKGSDVINLTRLLYDANGVSADYEVPETGGAARYARWNGGADTAVYIEDASFLKLREISLSYKVPPRYLNQLGGMQNATVTLSGRNLLTFTNYSGLDPEVSNFGRQAIARNIDVAPYPPSRSFWFSIEAGF